jgi:hypothetical protein
MKITKIILGCALATGLMTFAADKTQAAVINNALYVPFNLKLKISYQNGDKIKTASVSSKTVLADAGYSGKVTLAVGPSLTVNDFDIYVIQNNGKNSSVIADLSTNGVFVVSTTEFASVTKGTKTTSSGTVDISYASNFQDDFFDASGVYTASETDGKVNKGQFSEKQQFTVTSLSGSGFFTELDADASLTGSASGSASGNITVLL